MSEYDERFLLQCGKKCGDVVFHSLFREENKQLLGALISSVLGEQVKVVTTDKNRYVDTKEVDEYKNVEDFMI